MMKIKLKFMKLEYLLRGKLIFQQEEDSIFTFMEIAS